MIKKNPGKRKLNKDHVYNLKDFHITMSRKIYFAGSIRAGRDDADLYARLIEQLSQYGKVLTEHVGNSAVEKEEKDMSEKEIHDRDMEWLNESDYLVAEVTQPSLGVGYEIGRAIDLKKTVLCLFRPQTGKRLSAMIRGAENGSTFIVKDYKESEAPTIFKEFFKEEL
ncbi:putative 2'-deoxynucleoside 5'-phosphate N-hydrolase 1 isoform X1 [Mytilus trossulus]|uniref:putative 2'-deoxynucleoside 5'-phosphate N-hydrolase 1 isoform X1 n=2 Tax=Mytilus trossulus TaxID=6551 RepID=UPI003004E1AF